MVDKVFYPFEASIGGLPRQILVLPLQVFHQSEGRLVVLFSHPRQIKDVIDELGSVHYMQTLEMSCCQSFGKQVPVLRVVVDDAERRKLIVEDHPFIWSGEILDCFSRTPTTFITL